MNNLLFSLPFIFLLLIVPSISYSHTGEIVDDNNSGYMMMREVEDRALGDDLHEEMEQLMVKMMAGNMTDGEISRMIELTNEFPGPQAMMMHRFNSFGETPNFFGSHMMGNFSGYFPFYWVTQVLFWIVLLLAIIALGKWITKK